MKLLEPIQLNSVLTLKNRIIMAPMTRNKADDDLVPTQAMAEYYAKRSGAGLIVTEGTIIREDSKGYTHVPGIYSSQQIRGWKQVTDKVHAAGGKIFCQIWHVGRVAHPNLLHGNLPIGPSETQMSGRVRRAENLFYGKNRALAPEEIASIVKDFAKAATHALQAGFDGVELHGANGYLIDQFLHHSTNLRNDSYGGSPQNMARFAVEVVKACGQAIEFERVGIRLSPAAYLNEIEEDKRDKDIFVTLLHELNGLPIAYVHTGNFDDTLKFPSLNDQTMTAFIRERYDGNLIACGGYNLQDAEKALLKGAFDCVGIGRPFIANPDLVDKVTHHIPLNHYEPKMLDNLV